MKKKSNKRKVLITVLVILSILLALLVGLAVYLGRDQSDNPATVPSDDVSTEASDKGATEDSGNPSVGVSTEPSAEQTQPQPGTAPATEPDASTEPEAPTEPEDVKVVTKFGDHTYPGKWADQVRTEIAEHDDGGSVTYYGMVNGKEAVLFTIYYGKGTANSNPIGTRVVDGTPMTVSIEMSEFIPDDSWTEEEADIIRAMQEGVNDVIEHLKKDKNFKYQVGKVPAETEEPSDPTEPGQETEPDAPTEDTSVEETTVPAPAEDLVIKTPFCELTFPAKWAAQIRTEAEDVGIGHAVTFFGTVSGREVELFTVFFAAESERSFPVGVLTVDNKAMDVSVELAEVSSADNWSAEDMDTINAMQESVNYLIEMLKQTANFETV